MRAKVFPFAIGENEKTGWGILIQKEIGKGFDTGLAVECKPYFTLQKEEADEKVKRLNKEFEKEEELLRKIHCSTIKSIESRLVGLKNIREKISVFSEQINKEINIFISEKTKYYADLFLKEKGFEIGDVIEVEQEYNTFIGIILSYESFLGIESSIGEGEYGGMSGFKLQLLRKDGNVGNKKQYVWFCYMKSVKLVKKKES